MGDLISRQAAIKAIEDLQDCYNGFSDTYDKACIIGVIEEVPSIDPVKHGQWFKTGQSLVYPDKFRNYFCSECGFELDAYIRQEPNFCPNCGADMRGGEDGNID